jgi:hypothetical protein
VKFYKVGLKGSGFAILQPLPITSTRYQTVTRYQGNGGTLVFITQQEMQKYII